jgi:hypothetical protein
MNSAYADKCRFCGHEIKWIPDEGTRDDDEPDVSDRKSASQDIETVDEERNASSDRVSLDDIYNQTDNYLDVVIDTCYPSFKLGLAR